MKVLLLGASGFIGSALALSLVGGGHKLTGLGRDLTYARRALPMLYWIKGDLRFMQSPKDWREVLAGFDVVINAAGALQSGLRDDVEAVQASAMLALYEAAKTAGIKQVIQISAAGVETEGQTGFMSSKSVADTALMESGLEYSIIRPGLVIGRNCFGGTELLRVAAGVPWIEAVPSGTGMLQCTALSDVVAAVHAALDDPAAAHGSHDLVEPHARSLVDVIAQHRQWLGFAPPPVRLRVPSAALRFASLGADALGWLGWRSPLRSNAIAALMHGIAGKAEQARPLLGRDALSLEQTLSSFGPAGKADRWHARLAMIFPLALASLLALWLVSGILGFVQIDAARQVLVQGGMSHQLATGFVVGGSLADLAIVAGLLWRPWLGRALAASLALAFAYIAGSLVWSAELWLDPLGPMLKVLPILALTAMCMAMAGER